MKLLVQLSVSLLCLAGSACSSSVAPAVVSPVQGENAAPPQVDAVVPPASAAQTIRLHAGELPGSNGHRWGSRSYELRRTAAGMEVRLHDVTRFQGSGMSPQNMPAATHQCSAWEPLSTAASESVNKQLGGAQDEELECQSHSEVCAGLVTFLRDTAPAPAPKADPPANYPAGEMMVMHSEPQAPSYGRGLGGC